MKKSREELQVGDWYAQDCVRDLQQIVTLDDLEEARYSHPFDGGWETLDEALADLLSPLRYVVCPEALDDERAAAEERFGQLPPPYMGPRCIVCGELFDQEHMGIAVDGGGNAHFPKCVSALKREAQS